MAQGQLPDQASVVVIGAGIVGNSLTHHLADLGWRDIVLLDKGPLPNPGGSTGHASNFVFPGGYARDISRFTLESMAQYKELGVFIESGGIEVARTRARLDEQRRRLGSAKSLGEGSELLSAAEVKELVPFIDETVILGGFSTPGAGVVDPVRAGTLLRERAQSRGALAVFANTEIVGIDVEGGRVKRIRTDRGDIETEHAVICCGVWSPRIARMAGASIPLVPAVHQMVSVGPVPLFMETVGEIGYPIVRDMDTNMYERQHGSDLEIGSWAHRTILVEPDDIPSIEQSALSPTELPFTKEDFDPQMEDALELMPSILGDERVGIRHAINGLLSLTADGAPVLGETPEVKGLWTAAAVWIREAPAVARTIAQWMTDGCPDIDPRASDVARFHDHQRTRRFVHARSAEGFNKTYDIAHPMEQAGTVRDLCLSPVHERERELGAVFFETAGWERPQWYESNAPLVEEYGDRVMPRTGEWESRWWSPIVNAEHLAMRDRAGIVDLASFSVFDVTGPGAMDFLQRVFVNQMDVPAGRVVYAQALNDAGRIKADVTVMRLGPGQFRVVTGAATGMLDGKWLVDHLPDAAGAQVHDASSAWTTIGLWGPRARAILQALADEDVSDRSFPFAACRWIGVGPVRALAARISYVGELGWELSAPMEQGRALWDLLFEEGRPYGLVPVGMGVYGTTARLEKGYRAYGNELELDYDLVEAGLARASVKAEDFVGKAAYLRQRGAQPAAVLCTLTLDDPPGGSGERRFMLGREPVLAPDGGELVDRTGRRSCVMSAGSGPSLGAHLMTSYLPFEHATEGRTLAVEYFGERHPVTVAAVGSRPLFDPGNERMRS